MIVLKYIIIPLVFIFLSIVLFTAFISGGIDGIFNVKPSINKDLSLDLAPKFSTPELYTNDFFKLGDYPEKVTIILFWASWNNESIDQLAIFSNFLTNYRFRNKINFIAINSGEDEITVKNLINRGGYNVPIGLDYTKGVASKYKVNSLPTVFYIDKNGFIRKVVNVIQSAKYIGDNIENLIAN